MGIDRVRLPICLVAFIFLFFSVCGQLWNSFYCLHRVLIVALLYIGFVQYCPPYMGGGINRLIIPKVIIVHSMRVFSTVLP